MLFRVSIITLFGSFVACAQASAISLRRGAAGEAIAIDSAELEYRHLRGSRVKARGDLVERQANPTCLSPEVVQTGSASTGQAANAIQDRDLANFISFCDGETLTNGLQVKMGSCNGPVMGKIPATNNMISSVIISPQPGENLAELTTFNISVQITGLVAEAFTNPQETYYSAPQDLDGSGKIVGPTHVTVQDFDNSLTPDTAPDPTEFTFFKGISDAGNGQGLLSATVTGGLPAINYRVYTMSSSTNHQPVLMPVALRGAQDDCTKFTVGG